MLKILEKLLDRFIRQTYILSKPLHPRQFAYQEGKSTSLAVKSLVADIEKVLAYKNNAIGLSLDIEGAFDNVQYEVLKRALESKNVSINIINWIYSMLNTRVLECETADNIIQFKPSRGCPQGGALSPLLWTLVIDELLYKLNDLYLRADGFADDLFILIRGFDFPTMSELIQNACNLVESWCKEVGLSINPDKVNLIIFSRKKKITGYKDPLLFGKYIQPVKEVKYLGIYIDQKLNWEKHLDYISGKATSTLFTSKKIVGSKWGLKPNMMRWVYTAIVRPAMVYGSHIWYKKSVMKRNGRKVTHTKLQKVQRLALLLMTGASKSSPTDALEAITNITPLFLFIEGEAIMENYRTEVSELSEVNKLVDTNLKQLYEEKTLLNITLSDQTKIKYNTRKNYTIKIPSRKEWIEGKVVNNNFDIVWYTDGSKTENGVGAGIFNKDKELFFPLGQLITVFQAEIIAIIKCVNSILEENITDRNIAICTDSQATLKALDKDEIKSKLVLECCDNLKELAVNNEVTLFWVPGHSDIVGNEKADELAKKGSETKLFGPEPFCGLSMNICKFEKKKWMYKAAVDYWSRAPKMKYAKEIILLPESLRSKVLFQLSRRQLRIVTMFLTGHGIFKEHLYKIGVITDKLCRFCQEEDETATHLFEDCARFEYVRYLLYGKTQISLTEYSKMEFKDIMNYLRRTKLIDKFIEFDT